MRSCKNCAYFERPIKYGDPPKYDKFGNCKNPKINDVIKTGKFLDDGFVYFKYGRCFVVFKVGENFGCNLFKRKKKYWIF